MFCTQCGKQVRSEDRFCWSCGAAQGAGAVPIAARRLFRPRLGRKIAGVASGFAHYLDLDVTLVRILLILLALVSGGIPVLVAYLVAWILMPEEECVSPPSSLEQTART